MLPYSFYRFIHQSPFEKLIEIGKRPPGDYLIPVSWFCIGGKAKDLSCNILPPLSRASPFQTTRTEQL